MIALPPRGTRGVTVPKPVQWMMKSMAWTGKLMVRFGMKVQGRSLVLLITEGAHTGKRRETALGWFPEGDRSDSGYVIASNGGAGAHPGWAYNLAKNPGQVYLDSGDGEMHVDVDLLTGDERQSTWNEVVELAPGYGKYIEKTDREIPIFRLTRRP